MNPADLSQLLQQVAEGEVSVAEAERRLADLPFADLGFAKLDFHRELRSGQPEAVFAAGKSDSELVAIVARFVETTGRVLVTRLEPTRAPLLEQQHPEGRYRERSRLFSVGRRNLVHEAGPVVVLSAGTSDLAVAEEAVETAEWLGHDVERIYDVGVAGVHRLLSQLPRLRNARVAIVVAGMDGALPTLVAGLVACPVVAVPTSVGYGAAFDGLAALLTMLNGCAPGLAVVNIDNGFGAAVLASKILGQAQA
jgi:NCAIR mutase (PurE)-related protein